LTAAELVEAYLRRVDQYDGHLNAVVTLNGSAVAVAAVMDEHLMATGHAEPAEPQLSRRVQHSAPPAGASTGCSFRVGPGTFARVDFVQRDVQQSLGLVRVGGRASDQGDGVDESEEVIDCRSRPYRACGLRWT